ncbi:tryptophan--tRNA ligase [Candidatus Saccharibacteria bacterium]|nr:tryptophan--tRNA ligase [Candidatus Saccharibacteria bacterium]
MAKEVIFTGLRANNDLHIGNYFGALLAIVDISNHHASDFEIDLMVADLHSFTTPIDHSKLQSQIMENLKVFVAAGLPLDHPNIRVFRQSYIPAHSELAWILDCFTGMGQISRMTEFKDKSKKVGQNKVNVGLFNYPVLMASDVLLYDVLYVPVGDDQTQHLEFMRDIAEHMNRKFKQRLFVVPKPVTEQHKFFKKDQGLRIRDLLDPTKKMSKSGENGNGVIFLTDTPEAAAAKIQRATTDSIGSINFDFEKQPGVANLLQILALLSGKPQSEVNSQWEGKDSYGELKSVVAEAIKSFLTDFQAKLATVDETKLMQKLEADELAINKAANKTLLKVQKAVGLRPA